ncbi:MAG: hypothetical protein IPO91_25945 [Chloroflexi bacterium]|nr:hypothetical protein [Chloroflexota bacterium]
MSFVIKWRMLVIPGEESLRHDPRSSVGEPVQESVTLWERIPSRFDTSASREQRSDFAAAAARFIGERDMFARANTADVAFAL